MVAATVTLARDDRWAAFVGARFHYGFLRIAPLRRFGTMLRL